MPEQSPRPMNKLAETLLARLAELGAPARAGYFAGSTYCLGVYFRDDGAAAYLGFRLGEGWGQIDVDVWPDGRKFLVFRDAFVQA